MKPTKNIVFCIDCGRTKQLFDSQEKAIRFIEFNSEKILEESGKAPVRCYFCSACGGWHVTSSPYQLNIKTKSEIAIEHMRDTNANKKKYQDKIKEEKAKIKLIIDELPKKYEQTKESTKSQSKKVHILEEQVRSMKY